MNTRTLTAMAVAAFALTAPAAAHAAEPATITITTDRPLCTVHVDITWPTPEGPGGAQVNIDQRGAQDSHARLDFKGDILFRGDLPVTGDPGYDFVLAQGEAHVIEVRAYAHGIWTRGEAQLDCTVPVPPTVVEVPGPERVVEVPVLVAGPVRVVTRTVKEFVVQRCERVRQTRGPRKGRIVIVCPKRKVPVAKRPARRQPSFTG